MENPVGIYFTGFNRKFLWNFLIAPVRQVCGKREEKMTDRDYMLRAIEGLQKGTWLDKSESPWEL